MKQGPIPRKTKIVCTLGPACDDADVLKRMLLAGMDVARLNFSHGTHDEHRERIARLRRVAGTLGRPVGIMLDTKGPEIRTAPVAGGGTVSLVTGGTVLLTAGGGEATAEVIPVSYERLAEDVRPGTRILIDDGLIELEVTGQPPYSRTVPCRVVSGGELGSTKGVNIPGVRLGLPALTDKDRADLAFGVEEGVHFVAASFVRKRSDVEEIRAYLDSIGGDQMIIAKIESEEGVRNIDEIIKAADGVMVARGDLGVEIPLERVPLMQKSIIAGCNRAGKPVITATQMLDSMIRNPRPTRAEVTDVANAILDGTDAIMLSGETAQGSHPVEAVSAMRRIALRTEASLEFAELLRARRPAKDPAEPDAIAHATCQVALDLGLDAIVSFTHGGTTARLISKYRPAARIVAVTGSRRVAAQLTLSWGVEPVVAGSARNMDELLDIATEAAWRAGLVQPGNKVAVTAGLGGQRPDETNFLVVHDIQATDGPGREAMEGSAQP